MTELTQRFVLHFGEMGSRWGINRTVGQMYAYLVASPSPRCAEEIAAALQVSRSNVSMGLKELDSWQLLKRNHVPGDRREFFTAHGDAWDIFKRLAEQRLAREIAPTLSMLREALMEPAAEDDVYLRRRMRDMHTKPRAGAPHAPQPSEALSMHALSPDSPSFLTSRAHCACRPGD